ncbi:MAG TPA: DNA-processing protein DprA [Geobacteraceae bacterium]|nr:DNA-processing protein DprA [Geobacteraceae bacterium]
MDEYYHWFALRCIPHVGNVTYRRLLEKFGSPARVLAASFDELAAAKGVGPAAVASIRNHDYRRVAELEAEVFAKSGARLVTLLDDDYPSLLKEIPDPPPYLYLKGVLPEAGTAIAVVGSRLASDYGLATTSRLSRELAEQGVTIISGLAQGVDAAAHRGALQVSGRTIGVLGCGIDQVYPPANRQLFREMAEHGAIVSEFPMGTGPEAPNFPRRNRIISGLSRGVLVVEAAERSGSLITARFALEQGREVFAVPGNITHRASRGTNSLIKQGAKLVESVADILGELPPEGGDLPQWARQQGFNLSADEEKLCSLLSGGPLHIDELTVRSELTVPAVSAMLLRLELQGAVMQLSGKMFVLA